jgi:hypothetical protein
VSADPTNDDRILDALRDIIKAEVDRLGLRFAGVFGYTIQGVEGEVPDVLVSAVPNDPGIGLPDLVRIKMRPDIAGITSQPDLGKGCLVAFVDRDPSQPVIVSVESLGVIPIARLDDQVTIFLPPATVIQGTVSGAPFVGTIQIANPLQGLISQASGKMFGG